MIVGLFLVGMLGVAPARASARASAVTTPASGSTESTSVTATTPDWVTLAQCEAEPKSAYDGNYWHKNKSSWCRSDDRHLFLENPITHREYFRLWYRLTFIGRAHNGDRSVEIQAEVKNWRANVYNRAVYDRAIAELQLHLFPTCRYLNAGSDCGEPGQTFMSFPVMTDASTTRTYVLNPTTTTASPGDVNPEDKKGYYSLTPVIRFPETSLGGGGYEETLCRDDFRCDSASYSPGLGGCIFTNVTSVFPVDCSDGDTWESACFIKDAFEDIGRTYPGIPGTYVPGQLGAGKGPLTRNYYQRGGVSNKHPTKALNACKAEWGATTYTWRDDGQRNDCDEYPFASTYQNANAAVPPRAFAVRPVLSSHNRSVGGSLNAFYGRDRILDGDEFYVKVVGSAPMPWVWTPPPPETRTVMVVGDSISQGLEGDYTWRYRLKSYLGSAVNFVGPHEGTTRLPTAQPFGFPAVSAPAAFDGEYRNLTSFDSDHFAQWGRQAHQVKDEIRQRVADYQPDYLLVELGFNDLGWGVSDPDGVIADMMTIIAEARVAKPDVRILVANVPHRTFLSVVPDLEHLTDIYNSKLGPILALVNSTQSPVRLVDVNSALNPYADSYDGLHPNGVGEYRIARAFANVLAGQFALGHTVGAIPASVPDVVPSGVGWLAATPTASGINVRWDHSFGAGGYWLYQRDDTVNGTFERSALQIPADSWNVNWVLPGHQYSFYVVPARGDNISGPASPVGSAVADPRTAAGPNDLVVRPSTSYVDISWQPPTGAFSDTVTGYQLYYFDQTQADSFISAPIWAAGTSYRLTGLVPGHRYTIVVSSMNTAGEGFPSAGPEVIFGYGAPGPPTITAAEMVSPSDVQVRWNSVTGATSYTVWARNATTGEAFHPVGTVTGTVHQVGWLFDDNSADRWEWYVVAANGSLSGPPSAILHSNLDPPVLLTAQKLTASDVLLTWTAVPGAAFYKVLSRTLNAGSDYTVHETTFDTTHQIGWLWPPGADYWEWCVVAATQFVTSPRSNCMRTQQ